MFTFFSRYQLAANDLVLWFTERGAVCATATYGLNANGTISIHNAARLNNDPKNGTPYTIDGWAYQYDKKNPGHLWVQLLFPDLSPFFPSSRPISSFPPISFFSPEKTRNFDAM